MSTSMLRGASSSSFTQSNIDPPNSIAHQHHALIEEQELQDEDEDEAPRRDYEAMIVSCAQLIRNGVSARFTVDKKIELK